MRACDSSEGTIDFESKPSGTSHAVMSLCLKFVLASHRVSGSLNLWNVPFPLCLLYSSYAESPAVLGTWIFILCGNCPFYPHLPLVTLQDLLRSPFFCEVPWSRLCRLLPPLNHHSCCVSIALRTQGRAVTKLCPNKLFTCLTHLITIAFPGDKD